MADKRTFTVEIKGVKESYADVVKLAEILNTIHDITAKVRVETENNTKATRESNKVSTERKKVLTDEEKAQKKLNDTWDRATRIISQTEKDQQAANAQLRERAQFIKQVVQEETAMDGSIRQIQATLGRLRTQYRNLSEEQRENADIGGVLNTQISELDARYKELEKSIGNNRVFVGEYENATRGLNESLEGLSKGLQNSTDTARGFVGVFQLGVGTVLAFNYTNKEAEKTMQQLGKVLSLIGVIQNINNSLIKNGSLATKAAAAVEGVYALQIRARNAATVLATKNTIAATVAQRILNAVAAANPYLLLALGIAAVVSSLAIFSKLTGEATEEQKEFNSVMDGTVFRSQEAADTHDRHLRNVRELKLEYRQLTGEINSFQAAILKMNYDTQDALLEIENNFVEQTKKNKEEFVKTVEDAKWSLTVGKQFEAVLVGQERLNQQSITAEEERGRAILEILDVFTLQLQNRFLERSKAVGEYQTNIANQLKTGRQRELSELDVWYEEEKKKAQEFGVAQEDITRLYNQRRSEINNKYYEDAKKKREEAAKEAFDLARTYEDLITKSISSEYLRRETEINISYDRQIENYRKKLETDKSNKEVIDKIIIELQKQRDAELEKLQIDQSQKILDDQKNLLDRQLDNLTQYYNSISSLPTEVKGSDGLIDVDATRKNLEDANNALSNYIFDLQTSRGEIESYYDSVLALYNEDSKEYQSALQQKTTALRNVDKQIGEANKNMADNTQQTTELVETYWSQLNEKLTKAFDQIMTGAYAIFDTANMFFESQLEEATEKLDAISEKYDEIVEKREESDARVQELEEEAKNARGGRSIILQQQIDAEMQKNQQLSSQEKQLAKDKERAEKEVAKKERQQKRVQLLQNIAEAIANTSLAVTEALPNFVLAAIVGAAGAVQVGIMTAQLTKLEDGGLLKGKRHADGGMRVEGTNIEVEGGEFVINRDSTNKNLELIRYINSQRKEIGPTELSSFFTKSVQSPSQRMMDGGQIPIVDTSSNNDSSQIIDAIRAIRIEPNVSVRDINNAQASYVKVEDYTDL